MEEKARFNAAGNENKSSFSEIYQTQTQTRRPAQPVPVFHGTKRYKEAEEEE